MTESLHEKIYNELLHKIKTHFYEEGDQLPTEAELALQYNASKAPVRQALDRLQQEGFILRRPGKGTFIAGRREWPHLNLGGFEQDFEENNQYLYCKTLSVEDQPLPKEIAEAVGIPASTPAVSVRRIRYFKDKPIISITLSLNWTVLSSKKKGIFLLCSPSMTKITFPLSVRKMSCRPSLPLNRWLNF